MSSNTSAVAICDDNSQYIDPTTQIDLRYPDTLFRLELHSYMWAACGALAFFATVISGYLISTHLRNFSNPSQQRHIVRILLFIPIYSILSWCAFRYYTYAVYYFMIRDCYEAFVVYSFYALIMSYAGDVEEHLKTKGMMKYPFIGFLLPRYNPASRWFLPGNRVAVLQYVVVRPVMTLVAVVLQALQRYCPESFSPVYGHFWYMVLNVTSVSICMYALITMYYTIHDEIESYNPFSKFLSIKLVILLTMWQNLLIGMLVHYGVIQATQYWSRTNVGNGVQSMLVCFEMFVVSIVHLYAFSAKGYSNTGSKSLSFGKALSLCLNPVDIGTQFKHGADHIRTWSANIQRPSTEHLSGESKRVGAYGNDSA